MAKRRSGVSIDRWNSGEDKLLEEIYDGKNVKYCAEALGRSWFAVNHRIKKLGLVRDPWRWTEEENNFLREHYGDGDPCWIAKKLGKGFAVIHQRAKRLGLKKTVIRGLWTQERLRLLQRYYPIMSNENVASNIGIGRDAIARKAKELGLKKSEEVKHCIMEQASDLRGAKNVAGYRLISAEGVRMLTTFSRTSIWRMCKDDPSFPKPLKLGKRYYWVLDEVEKYLTDKIVNRQFS